MQTHNIPARRAKTSLASIMGYGGNHSRRDNMRAVTVQGGLIDADHIFGATKVILKTEAQQDKAEATNRAKSNFLTNMSHEIRTPMGAIISLSQILLSTKLNFKQKQCVTVLQTAAEDLMTMINGMLEIEKIESKIIDLEHMPFNMPAMLGQIVSLLSVKAEEKNIGLTLHYDMQLPQIFSGDCTHIRQIVMNLVGNAIKFTHTGGVTVSCTGIGSENGETRISISVTDTGIGIAEDKITVIFGRFVQADSSIAHKYGGTGLGLAISKALAENMGGAISVDSVAGKGSTFILHLQLPVAAIHSDPLPHLQSTSLLTNVKCMS